MNFFERVLLERHDELGLAAAGLGRRIETAVLTPRFSTSRHVIALVFPAGGRGARVVAKIPRRPGDNGGVEREAAMLRRLAELNGSPVPGVPVVLGTLDLSGQTLLVETVVDGTELAPWVVARDRDRAVSAGVSFISALPVVEPASRNRSWYDRALAQPLAQLADQSGSGEVGQLCERTHAVLEPMRNAALPAVFEHGDLSHPNLFLLRNGATLGVIDWERASTHGLPGHDLAFFLQYVSESARSAFTHSAQCQAFDDTFLDADAWGRVLLGEQLGDRGVDPALSGLLLVATWARSAATLVSRLAGAAGSGGPIAALADVVATDRDVALWRHCVELAERGRLSAR